MAEPYLRDLQAIVAQSCVLPGNTGVICRHFFSGAAAYAGGRIFMTLTPAGLALKLSEEDRRRLFDLGATPLKYFPNAPVKKDYALLPPRLMDDETMADSITHWITRSMKFVL